MISIIGWLGSILFAICAVPQAWLTFKTKRADGISWAFLLMWFFGEVLTSIYIIATTMDMPLLFNYAINFLCLLVILFYKIKQRNVAKSVQIWFDEDETFD